MEARRRSAISRGRCLRSVVFTVEVPALASEQGRKGPIGGDQGSVPDSCFDDAPLLEHDDPIGIAKRLEPVRDDKHGGAECSQSSDEAGLCERILVAGRLVEDEHATRQIRRRVKQRTGEGEALALPARETEPASPDDCPQVKIIELDECEARCNCESVALISARRRLTATASSSTNGSWLATDTRRVTSRVPRTRASSPSMRTFPTSGSRCRCASRARVDFPDPVAPTTPTNSPRLTSSATSQSTGPAVPG